MTWIVTCEKNYGVLDYYVECKETGERKGTFDCERWAQEFADELNKQGKGARLEGQIVKGH